MDAVEAAYDDATVVTQTVLHVLPHPGAGGETYVDLLEPMEGFRFERVSLTERRGALEVVGGVARARRAARNADLVHVHGDTAAIICVRLLRRRPGVITFNGLHLLRRSRGLPRRLLAFGLRRAIGRARASICVSESELRDAALVAARELREKLVLIHNGVPDPGPIAPDVRSKTRRELGLSEEDLAVLYIGQLEARKGVLDLALALESAHREQATLTGVFAGDGPLRKEMASRAPSINARVLGHRDDVDALMRAADVFVMPSEREGLSFAVLEAMARGLAVVVSDGPGNPDAVGEAGIVFPYGQPKTLATALGKLAADSRLRAQLGEAARARARTDFSADRMVAETREVYERALESSDGL
jgi:glycosyltransferase involved in cell wall biosynthesis